MEGFDFSNSVLETRFKHSNYYANYGVDKISKPDNNNNNNTYNQTKPTVGGEHKKGSNRPVKSFVSTDIKGALNKDFIDKTVTNYNGMVVDTMTDDKDDKDHKLRKAFIIGGSTALFGGISLLLTKGKLSKTASKYLNKLTTNISNKITEIKQKPEMSKYEEMYVSGLQIADKAFTRIQGTLFNMSPIKDVLFEKIVRDKLGMTKICDGITNWFRKVSFGTVKSMYKKTTNNVNSMTGSFVQMNERIANNEFGEVGKDVIASLDKKVKRINSLYNGSFSEQKITDRSANLVKKFDGLGEKAYQAIYGDLRGFIKDTDKWSTFITEKLVAGDKAKVIADLTEKKRALTNTPKDLYADFTESISGLEKIINPKDKTARDVIKKLRAQANQYIKAPEGQDASQRGEILKDIRKTVAEYSSSIKEGEENAAQREILKQMDGILQNTKQGAIEDILAEYKKILPEKEYNELLQLAQRTRKSLDKSVYNEGTNYTDKLRDLASGSALTDVAIGTAVPVLATGVAVSAADTKEKKRSVLLKYGIPLMVGIATTTTCALRLISGGKSLILGTVTSTLTNEVCDKLDKKLKAKSGTPEQTKTDDNSKANKA